MKREAVQTERDRISRVNNTENYWKAYEIQRPPRGSKMMNPEDDLSMEILRRAEKMANEAYPEAVRDHNKESVKVSWVDWILYLISVERK